MDTEGKRWTVGRWLIREEDGGRRLVADGYALPRDPVTHKREIVVAPVSELQQLQGELEAARKERDEAVGRKAFCEQWYAERIRRLRDTAEREGIWPEVACILANGTAGAEKVPYEYEPPTYAQLLNAAKYRAEALRDQLDEAASRHVELEDLSSLLERDSSTETTYNVAQSLSALADVLRALPQRAIGQHDEIQALHDRADAAEEAAEHYRSGVRGEVAGWRKDAAAEQHAAEVLRTPAWKKEHQRKATESLEIAERLQALLDSEPNCTPSKEMLGDAIEDCSLPADQNPDQGGGDAPHDAEPETEVRTEIGADVAGAAVDVGRALQEARVEGNQQGSEAL